MQISLPTLPEDWSLVQLRDFTYIITSFAGFLRFDEASKIRRSHIHLSLNHLIIDIVHSKTDQFSKGNQLCIARTSSPLCVLTWMVRYLRAAGAYISHDQYVFRAVFHDKKKSTMG